MKITIRYPKADIHNRELIEKTFTLGELTSVKKLINKLNGINDFIATTVAANYEPSMTIQGELFFTIIKDQYKKEGYSDPMENFSEYDILNKLKLFYKKDN